MVDEFDAMMAVVFDNHAYDGKDESGKELV